MISMRIDRYEFRRADSLGESTLADHRWTLTDLQRFLKGKEPDSDSLNRWVDELKRRGLKPSTIRQYLYRVRSYLETMGKDSAFVDRLLKLRFKEPSPRVRNWLEPTEVRKILQTEKDPMYRAIFSLAYTYARRISEVLDLRRKDVDLDRGTIRFWIRKRREPEEVWYELEEPARSALREWLSRWKGERVFPVTRNSVWLRLKKLGQALGIRVHPHLLRHSKITHLLEHGVDLKTIQEAVAHHSSFKTTTDIYSHVTPKMIARIPSTEEILGEKET